MSETSFIKRRWKLLLNIVTIAALLILTYAIRDQLKATLDNLERVNFWVLWLILPLEALNYHAQVRLYQGLFHAVGKKLPYKNLLKATLELNFVNHVFPSGGVSGISYFTIRLRRENVRPATTTLVQTMKLILIFLSFEILLFFGMFVLAVNGRASGFVVFIGTALATALLLGTGVFVYIIGSNTRIDSFFTWLTRLLNRLIQLVRPRHPETINIGRARTLFTEFHSDYQRLYAKRRLLRQPFWFALLANVTEVLVVYVVYVAFGEWVNFGAIVLAYAIANFAGLISVLPGGVGIYEAIMTAVLATAGIPAAVSIPVTVMYRVLNTLIQLPPGYYFYHQTLHGTYEPNEASDA